MLHFRDDGLPNGQRVVPVGQVKQHGETGRAFHETAYRAFTSGPAYEVSFPMTGNGTVFHAGGTITDHDHRVTETRCYFPVMFLWVSSASSGA